MPSVCLGSDWERAILPLKAVSILSSDSASLAAQKKRKLSESSGPGQNPKLAGAEEPELVTGAVATLSSELKPEKKKKKKRDKGKEKE